jgi:hypothetical protein
MATRGRANVERWMGMKRSPADMILAGPRDFPGIPSLNGARSAKVYAVLRPIARQLLVSA